MTMTTDKAPSAAPARLGSSITGRSVPPAWWGVTQLAALSFHIPLSVMGVPTVARGSALKVGMVVALAAITIYYLMSLVTSKWRALAVVSAVVVLFWHWSGIGSSGPLAAVALSVVVVAAAAKFSHEHFFKVLSFVASAAVASSLLLTIVINDGGEARVAVAVQNPVEQLPLVYTPDIILLILDGYGRSDVIESVYGFDNQPFLDLLTSQGFEVADRSTANYTVTHLSVPALLNMSYMHQPGDLIGRNDLVYLADQMSGDSDLVRLLKTNGYTYVHGESDHWFNVCGDSVDVCLPGPALDITGYSLLAKTPVGPLLFRENADPTTALNRTRVAQLTNWDETISDWPEGPVFAFLHLQLPHPPLLLDSACEVRVDPDLGGRIMNDGSMTPEQLEKRKTAWLEQIQCANATVARFLEKVDRKAVVVLVSDHGPDLLFPWIEFGSGFNPNTLDAEAVDERFPNLTAVRLPDSCKGALPDDVDSVNLFRVVVGCLSNREVGDIPTRKFIAGFGGPIVEVNLGEQNADE